MTEWNHREPQHNMFSQPTVSDGEVYVPSTAENKTVELKPCPFCGSPAHVEQSCNGGRRLLYWVECEECYSRSQSYFDHPDGAIESWNKRANE